VDLATVYYLGFSKNIRDGDDDDDLQKNAIFYAAFL